MRIWKWQAIVLLLLIHVGHFQAWDSFTVDSKEFVRVCYFQSWAASRQSPARFDVENIDGSLCTHLIYAHASVDTTAKKLVALNIDDYPGGRYSKFSNIKRCHRDVKTLLAVEQPINAANFYTDLTTGDSFSTDAVQLLRNHGFDGLDLEWRGDSSTDGRTGFIQLLEALRSAMDATGTKLLLTLSTPSGSITDYPIENFIATETSKYVDYILLKSYKFDLTSSNNTIFASGLFRNSTENTQQVFTLNYTVNQWKSEGLPFNKMVVGLTGVGTRYVLKNVNQVDVGSPTTGDIRTGRYYKLRAALAYPEVCELRSYPLTKTYFDDVRGNPYLVNGDDWVGYEDKKSLQIKLKWMHNLQVAGVLFSSLDVDDFSGKFCNEGKYPLLNTIYSVVKTLTNTESSATGTAARIATPSATLLACDTTFLMSTCTILQILLMS